MTNAEADRGLDLEDSPPGPEDPSPDEKTPPRVSRRTVIFGAGAALVAAGALTWHLATRFPPDTEPQGAYMRIAYSVSRGQVSMVFPYLEDEAQHACFTIRDYRRKASDLVDKSYPEPERTRLIELYKPHAEAVDGSDVWVDLAAHRGFIGKLRRDLSGIAKVEVDGERATIETARGTRYAFRRRPNGIWGLTLFSPELTAEAERAARDFDVVTRAAADYDRAGK